MGTARITITTETVKQVIRLKDQGMTIEGISQSVGISISSVKKILRDNKNEEDTEGWYIYEWLVKNWHFKRPGKGKVRKSNFRTPYHPHGMWIKENEEGNNER